MLSNRSYSWDIKSTVEKHKAQSWEIKIQIQSRYKAYSREIQCTQLRSTHTKHTVKNTKLEVEKINTIKQTVEIKIHTVDT